MCMLLYDVNAGCICWSCHSSVVVAWVWWHVIICFSFVLYFARCISDVWVVITYNTSMYHVAYVVVQAAAFPLILHVAVEWWTIHFTVCDVMLLWTYMMTRKVIAIWRLLQLSSIDLWSTYASTWQQQHAMSLSFSLLKIMTCNVTCLHWLCCWQQSQQTKNTNHIRIQ